MYEALNNRSKLLVYLFLIVQSFLEALKFTDHEHSSHLHALTECVQLMVVSN